MIGVIQIIARTICTRNATINIHTGCYTDSVKTEETVSRIVSEYYERRMKGNRLPNNWSSSKLDAQGVGRI